MENLYEVWVTLGCGKTEILHLNKYKVNDLINFMKGNIFYFEYIKDDSLIIFNDKINMIKVKEWAECNTMD